MNKAATTAAEFHSQRLEGEIVTLPSTGRLVRMKAVKPAELLRLGGVPDILAELVIGFLYGHITEEQYKDFFSPAEKIEQALDLIESLRIVCTCALIEPEIQEVPDVDNGIITIDDLEDTEQRLIFDLAMLGASSLHSFCKEQEAALEALANEQDHGTETK